MGAIEVEANAVELGLMFARDLSIQNFTLESDSLTLINALQDLSPPPSSVAALIFSSVAMSHLLAKHALGIEDLSVWVEEIPCFLE